MPCYITIRINVEFKNLSSLKKAARELGYAVSGNSDNLVLRKGYTTINVEKNGNVWNAEHENKTVMGDLEDTYTAIEAEKKYRAAGWKTQRRRDKNTNEIKITLKR